MEEKELNELDITGAVFLNEKVQDHKSITVDEEVRMPEEVKKEVEVQEEEQEEIIH